MESEATYGGRSTIGIPKETAEAERRVALIPDAVKRLTDAGAKVLVEAGAGLGSFHDDAAYQAAGATIMPDAADLYRQSDLLIKVQRPLTDGGGANEVDLLRDGGTVIALLAPLSNGDLVRALADKQMTSFSMDSIPRTTRAQSMDVLSSQATVAGYKAVLLAADHAPRFFPMLTTAAGSITPAKVLVIGAGVAGLQAIATARRLGAVVEAYDTRPVVKEQVESLGARFVEIDTDTKDAQDAGGYAKEVSADVLRRQQEVLADRAARSDVIITTAAVPGRPAPRLISAETVERMRPGSVIVDLAAETGGNCELTKADEVIEHNGVLIIGLLNLPSTMPIHASQMYSKNVQNLLALLIKDGRLEPDFNDDIVQGTCITRDGAIVHEATRQRLGIGSDAAPPASAAAASTPAVTDADATQLSQPEPVPETLDDDAASGIADRTAANGVSGNADEGYTPVQRENEPRDEGSSPTR
jgi:NAD(P) transhydrogenase subunit alpha